MCSTFFLHYQRHIVILLLLLSLFEARGQSQKYRIYGNKSYIEFLNKQGIYPEKDEGKALEPKNPITLSLSFVTMVEGITKDQLSAQIKSLNEDFSNKTFEASDNKSPYYKQLATDTGISFCSEFSFVKGDTKVEIKYDFATASALVKNNKVAFGTIPIYIVAFDNMAGYAQAPGYPVETDAIFIDKDFLWGTKTEAYALGKTLTHLIGIYLGLGELWDCTDDDIFDTPLMSVEHFDHEGSLSSCYRYVVYTQPQNFMYNTQDKYMNMFSRGQKEGLWLELSTRRQSLLQTAPCK